MKHRSNPVLIVGLALLLVTLAASAALYLKTENNKPAVATASTDYNNRAAVMAAPTITWVRPPQPSERGRLNMAFKVESSTPLRNLKVQIEPIVKMAGTTTDKDSRDVPTWLLGQRVINWDGEIDLTSSPLAGSPVTVEIVATDDDKRSGNSEVVSLTLPERVFTNSLAKSLYNLRKALRQDPDKRNEALRALATVLQQREFFEDKGLTLLTLRSAAVRIALDRSDEGLNSALDLLWHAAVLFEQDQVKVADKVSPVSKAPKNN
jgi:hypothetical protein